MGHRLGIFDSGVGGLSVYKEVKKRLSNAPVVYLADQKNLPYGNKPQKEIRRLTSRGIKFLENNGCSLVIIACNTATTGSIDYYRRKFPNLKLVGVVPPIKPAAQRSKSKGIVILSTSFTARSRYLKNLIRRFAPNCQVTSLGCPDLVELVEKGNIDSRACQRFLRRHLDYLIPNDYDALVIGCTHFSFLKNEIQKIYGRGLEIFDPGLAVAQQTRKVWLQFEDQSKSADTADQFYTSGSARTTSNIAGQLLGKTIKFQKAN